VPVTVDVVGAKAAEASKDMVSLGYAAGRVGTVHGRTAVVYGVGAKAAAAQIAGHLNAAAASAGSAVPAGHVLVTLGTDYTPPAPASTAAEPGSPAPSEYAGPAVIAGGIPCVD
jgi:hypothetical protein